MKSYLIICSLAALQVSCTTMNRKTDEKVLMGSTQVDVSSDPKSQSKRPRLKPPKIRIRHVDDQVKDGVFIPAHLEYEIQENSRWED